MDLRIVAEQNNVNPQLGAGKLADKLRKLGMPFSRATVGRMLALVAKRCPTCRGTQGNHDAGRHAVYMNRLTAEINANELRVRYGEPLKWPVTGRG